VTIQSAAASFPALGEEAVGSHFEIGVKTDAVCSIKKFTLNETVLQLHGVSPLVARCNLQGVNFAL